MSGVHLGTCLALARLASIPVERALLLTQINSTAVQQQQQYMHSYAGLSTSFGMYDDTGYDTQHTHQTHPVPDIAVDIFRSIHTSDASRSIYLQIGHLQIM